MKYAVIPLSVVMALLSGCVLSVRGGFSPVQGPLSQQSPIPTYDAVLTGAFSGTIRVVLADGEVCKGPWHFVSTGSAPTVGSTPAAGSAPAAVSTPAVTPAAPASNTIIVADWDRVYGRGYYVAHVLGNKLYARAALTGSKGTTLEVELSNENNTRGNTRGIALDNRGNLFKVSVYN